MMVLPSLIRAFMLFRRADVEDYISRDLILTKLDYEDEETLYDQMETRLKEVLVGGPGSWKRPRQTTRRRKTRA